MLMTLHFASCAAMTGIIWIVQLLIYPGFAFVDENQFLNMHNRHTNNITLVVGPFMGLEMLTAALLTLQNTNFFFVSNLVGVIFLWALTGFVSVPIHNELAKKSKSVEHIRKLTQTNWPRTTIWTIRLVAICLHGVAG
jgi:membrane glycosyltransferase